jgi:hypothetical protein
MKNACVDVDLESMTTLPTAHRIWQRWKPIAANNAAIRRKLCGAWLALAMLA